MPTIDQTVKKTKRTFIPAYRRIESSLREQLQQGVWPMGTMIPGRRELAKQYGVDLNTLQNAIRVLVEDGTLRAEGRRGTFVAIAPKPGSSSIDMAPSIHPSASKANFMVGVIASVDTKIAPDVVFKTDWQALIVRHLEQTIGQDSGATVNFLNLWSGDLKTMESSLTTAIQWLIKDGVDVLVVIGPNDYEIDGILMLADASRIPIVLVTPDYAVKRMTPQIRYDNAHAAFLAGAHLLNRGYRNLTFFEPFAARWTEERLSGLREAVQRAGLPTNALQTSDCDRSVDARFIRQSETAYEFGIRLLQAPLESWGIVAANDHVGWGLLRAAEECGLVAGKDFGLVAFDDLPESRDLGLTSLRPPFEQMGEEAAKMVCRALHGGRMPMEVTLQSHLVPRKSSLPYSQTR